LNILMLTNTFAPHVGGVARSVQRFADEFRKRGHRVLIVAPEYEGLTEPEPDVVRVPALRNFNGSDFSVPVPITRKVARALKTFAPEIVHSHHPYLLGGTALRVAASRGIPAVFTHHSRYEAFTHYLPGDSPRMKRFVLDLVTGYCKLCDAVIAPSFAVARQLASQGVEVPIEVIPTGVDLKLFSGGSRALFRSRLGIPEEAFLVGHVGRLALEKNLSFLADAVARFLLRNSRARFLLVGDGPMKEAVRETFESRGLTGRLHLEGALGEEDLSHAYKGMDVFAFASRTETQGMVLAEAMAAGTPVVAIDAPGVREVVRDRENGRLVPREDAGAFAAALSWIAGLSDEERKRMGERIARTAEAFSMSRTADRALALYGSLIGSHGSRSAMRGGPWTSTRNLLGEEWKIVRNLARAAGVAARSMPEGREQSPPATPRTGRRGPGRRRGRA
jgi:glycosyltransferase involved in cell wall biosynthesis